MGKLAFLFLTYAGSDCYFIWDDFFKGINKDKYIILCHPKYPEQISDFLSQHIITNRVETIWSGVSIVLATFRLLEEAFKDKDVSHFLLLSHNSAPLIGFDKMCNSLDGKKSYIAIKPENRHRQWFVFNRDFVDFALKFKKDLFSLQESIFKGIPENIYVFDECWVSLLLKISKESLRFFSNIFNNKHYVSGSPKQNVEESLAYEKRFCKPTFYYDKMRTTPEFGLYHFSIEEYWDIKQNVKNDKYFFIRKVVGTDEEYRRLKSETRISDYH